MPRGSRSGAWPRPGRPSTAGRRSGRGSWCGGWRGRLARLFRRGGTVLTGSGEIPRRTVPSRLTAYLTREVLLALLVFGCTAILTESTPARPAHHLGPHPPRGEP